MVENVRHMIDDLGDGRFHHSLSFILGPNSRLELVAPDGEVVKSWESTTTPMTVMAGGHDDDREDLDCRLAYGTVGPPP